MLLFVFKDSKNNSIEITAPSKVQAMKMLKATSMGGGSFRYDSHREETPDEWRARMDRAAHKKQQGTGAEMRRAVARATGPPAGLVGRRKRIGANHPCLCGSGRKYKRCCGRRR